MSAEFGLAVWSTPAWVERAVSWMDDRIAAAGIERTGCWYRSRST